MRNKLKGFKEALFAETLLVVLPPSVIGFLAAGYFSVFGIFWLLMIVAFWDLGINVINHYSDWHLDEVNEKRSNMHKYILKEELLTVYFIFLVVLLLIAYFLLKPPSLYFYVVLLIEILFGIFYSMYFKMKEKFIINYIWIALMYGLFSFLLGFFAINSSASLLINYLPLIIFITLLYFSICIVKDYSDIEGDAAEGRKSIPIVLGVKKTLQLQYVLITLAYVILLLFVILGYLNILLLSTFFFYLTIILILSMINNTKDTKYMRTISFYTKVNTLALDILIIIVLLLSLNL